MVETISTEAAPGKPVSTTPVSKPEKTNSGSWCETGVPECDLYMKYTREKFEKQVGVPLSERLEKALQESCDAWKKATTKAGPEEIAKHCLPGLRVFLSDS